MMQMIPLLEIQCDSQIESGALIVLDSLDHGCTCIFLPHSVPVPTLDLVYAA